MDPFQAWIYTEAMASFAPGLGLCAPSNVSIDCRIFQWKCPLQNEIGLALALLKMKIQACILRCFLLKIETVR